MASDNERHAAGTTVARYEALILVSEALRAYHDRETLFRSLARELRPVVHFSFLGLALYDERTEVVEPYVLQSTGERGPLPQLTSEDQLTFWVLRHRAPLVVDAVAHETRFAQEMEYLRSEDTQSICCLPLITPQRQVGMLIAGSRETHEYSGADVAFLSLVANQVALAVDDTLNFGALQAALAVERERVRNQEASDDLLRTLSPVLDIRQVFSRISEIAATVVPHDRLTLTLHDQHDDVTLVAASDGAEPMPHRVSLASGTDSGEAWFLVDDLAQGHQLMVQPAACLPQIRAAGYRSVLGVRLAASDRRLGLQLWSRSVGAFNQRQVPLARRIADHVALALSQQRLAEEARRTADVRERADALERRVTMLAAEVDALGGHRRVVGVSQPWKGALKQATQVAATDTTVLLVGESGTGKEVVARFIHRASTRSGGPFVAINCAALPEQLLESELFGYERGAFTGAVQPKPGQLELASGGVLFLDEVGEMSASAQAKLLRVLQEREFQRLGGTRTLKANVRVVSATNRNLRAAVERGTFREDLYYRLNVFEIRLPPLRERRDDILPLSEAFLEEIGRTIGRPPGGIAREARDGLLSYAWPGNVRELRNVLERAVILCEGGLITTDHLTFASSPADVRVPGIPTIAATDRPQDAAGLRFVEKGMIERALADAKHNKSLAAKNLGLTRKQLYVRLRQHGLT
jgi:formate hydrogenlyase transcriptional activator